MEHAMMHIQIPRLKEHSDHSPISRLPSETLAEIFRLNTLPDTDDGSHISSRLSTLFKCSQVSRYWRGVAVEYANLWSRIDSPEDWTSSPEWIKFLLTRSKSAPLYLSFNTNWASNLRRFIRNGNVHTFPENVLSTLEHMHRVKALNIRGNAKSLAFLFPYIFGSPAFLLESLSIESQDKSLINLPDPLFEFPTPQLRRLRLERCGAKWNSMIFLSGLLTHLDISYHIPTMDSPSFSEVLTILQSSPGLQELTLQGLYDFSALLEVPSQIIQLSHLSVITLSGILSDCARLLLHIAYPPSVMIRLDCDIAGSETNISAEMDVLSTKGIKGVGKQKTVYLDSDIHYLKWSVAEVGVSDQTYILLRWSDSYTSVDISGLVLSIWRAVRDDSDYIVEFEQNIYLMVVSKEVASEVLEGLSAVTKIKFSGLSRPFVTGLLQRHVPGVNSASPFCLPLLREIIFSGLPLSARLTGCHPDSVAAVLCDYLVRRLNAGCGIESITLDNPPYSTLGLTNVQMHLLRSSVSRLHVIQ